MFAVRFSETFLRVFRFKDVASCSFSGAGGGKSPRPQEVSLMETADSARCVIDFRCAVRRLAFLETMLMCYYVFAGYIVMARDVCYTMCFKW